MRLATWNINGLRARIDFLRIWLRERQPDVVGLQELKITDEEFPTAQFSDLGYHVLTHGQKAWNGVAILSRKPAEVVDRGLAGQEEMGARLISARIDEVLFTTVYCPNGKELSHDDYPRKLAWFDALAGYWATKREEKHAVLCGDFNVVPTPQDSWSNNDAAHIFHTPEERQRFSALLDLGLVDLFREQHPDEKAFSWWDYRGGAFHRGHGLRIDLLLGSAALRQRMKSAHIDRDFRKKQEGFIASDHAPVYVDID